MEAEERVRGRVKDGPVVRSSWKNVAAVRSFLEGGGRTVEAAAVVKGYSLPKIPLTV